MTPNNTGWVQYPMGTPKRPPPERPDDTSGPRRREPRSPYPVERPDIDERPGPEPDVAPGPTNEPPPRI
jgi:hypothetical protein